MARTRRPYAREFREKMVALVRSGRSPAELSREFEPTAQTNRQLGSTGGPRRGSSDGRSDERRADGAAPDQARESASAGRAGHSGKGRGLQRQSR